MRDVFRVTPRVPSRGGRTARWPKFAQQADRYLRALIKERVLGVMGLASERDRATNCRDNRYAHGDCPIGIAIENASCTKLREKVLAETADRVIGSGRSASIARNCDQAVRRKSSLMMTMEVLEQSLAGGLSQRLTNCALTTQVIDVCMTLL